MIKLLFFEIQKLISKKNFIITILLLFTLQFFLIFVEESQSENPIAKYNEIYEEVKKDSVAMSIEDKYTVYKQKAAFLENVETYENALLTPFENEESEKQKMTFVDEAFLEQYNMYQQSQKYLHKDEYLEVYTFLSAYYDEVVHYENYLAGITKKAEDIKNASWSPVSTKKTNELKLLVEKYEKLHGLVLQDKGIQSWQHYATSKSSLLIILLWMFIAISVVQGDEKTEMDNLLCTCEKGNIHLWVVKLLTILLFGILATCIVEAGTLLIMSAMYGHCSFSAIIQSIPFFYTSPYAFTIAQWYTLHVLLKVCVCFSVTMIFTLLYSYLKKGAFLVMVALMGISFILYSVIDTNSLLRILHYVNLFYILNVSDVYRTFVLFELASIPVYLPQIIWLITLGIAILFSLLYLLLAKKKLHFSIRQISLPIFSHTNLFIHELEKIILNNKLFLVCLLCLVLQGFYMYQGYQNVRLYQHDEHLIELYKEYGGKLTNTKREHIEKLNKEYEQQEENFVLAGQQYQAGIITDEQHQEIVKEYVNESKARNAFKMFYSDYLQSTTHIVYAKGYQAIFGIHTNIRDTRIAMLICITLIFSLYGLFASDRYRNEDDLYMTTQNGRSKRFHSKEKCALLIAIVTFLIYYGSDFLMFYKLYPMFQWNTPLYEIIRDNLNVTSTLPLDITLWQYTSILYLVRFIGVMLCALFIVTISKKTDNLMNSLFISSTTLLIPMLLFNFGLQFVLFFSLFDLLAGNQFLLQNLYWWKIIVITGICIYFYQSKAVRR